MLLPSMLQDNFVDDVFQDFFSFPFKLKGNFSGMMKTDVKETGDQYQLDIELPGYAKEDIKAELKNGYLSISAKKEEEHTEKNENGKYICQERYTGQCQRRFYVGEHITQEDIKASFENGILKVVVPKQEVKEKLEESRYIAIE
ncbi:Hsp20/alpha crystallin family protein [Anaeromicropila populeti]|uniref:Heat shock protein Hsp20 n=1 Tax=Anaeromicropila populeti TaxID=37658 RepID=A0A1I6IE85_9FIRM|nr:Hsp20/alpha crystallin family protein [Anaeromicropila populeti]SFR64939.1 heat shock protein Hsp20 [Anaeromicropila populeti]